MAEYGTLREYTPLDDVWVMGLVLGCFLALILLIGHQRKYIGKKSRKFFLPTNHEEKSVQKTAGERSLPYFASFILIASSGLMLFVYVNMVYNLEKSKYYIWSVLLLCLGAFAGYYLLRWVLYSFVNWVFFDRHKCRQWMSGFGLLTIYESVLVFVLMCAAMFYHFSFYETGLSIVLAFCLLRILVIPYTKRIFFPDFYGLLHLIAYLCTLEIVPLLALWKFCMFWGSNLIVR